MKARLEAAIGLLAVKRAIRYEVDGHGKLAVATKRQNTQGRLEVCKRRVYPKIDLLDFIGKGFGKPKSGKYLINYSHIKDSFYAGYIEYKSWKFLGA